MKKAGWMSKSYKLKADLVERFAEACEKEKVSQARKLSEMMERYIKEVEKREKL